MRGGIVAVGVSSLQLAAAGVIHGSQISPVRMEWHRQAIIRARDMEEDKHRNLAETAWAVAPKQNDLLKLTRLSGK